MSRIDIPTLKCDRCGFTTQDTNAMGSWQKLTGMWDNYQSAHESWDLCPTCWLGFDRFINKIPDQPTEPVI